MPSLPFAVNVLVASVCRSGQEGHQEQQSQVLRIQDHLGQLRIQAHLRLLTCLYEGRIPGQN